MGKKSKKKAAKALPFQEGSTAGAGGTVSVGKKNTRCVGCSGTVKVLEGKGHTCVGCSGIYCHRCEKKQFRECQNGNECAHLIRRCPDCYFGLSLLDEMEIESEETNVWPEIHYESYSPPLISRMYAELGGDLQRAIVPFGICHDCGENHTIECYMCASSPKVTRLVMCNQCKLLKCGACLPMSLAAMRESLVSAVDAIDASVINVPEFCAATEETLVKEVPTSMIVCSDCFEMTCVACLDGNGLERFIKRYFRRDEILVPFCCDTCYYTKKPCTNPTCPNPIGVPTKRCGGCHISRYCSKECQAADYPGHDAKCERMQEKLAAKN